MSDPTVVRGDRHDISWTIDTDLTGATVVLVLRPVGGGEAVEITGSVDGSTATFPWADQVDPGIYACEIEVSRDEQIVTAPPARPGTLRVREALNPPD
jgi:hypothetical protein